MKMKKNVIPLFAALAIVTLLSATMVAAYGGWRGDMSDEERAAVQTAIEKNDYVGWKKAIESGLTQERFSQMRVRHLEMEKRRAAIEAALEAKDFAAWKAAVSESGRGSKMLEFVTAENFALFVEMHEAMKSGDSERVKEIKAELGLPSLGCDGSGRGFEKMNGMHRGRF